MSFELEWGIALAVVVGLVALVVFLPKKKKLPMPKFGDDEGEQPATKPLFFAVLPSLLSGPSVYAVCQVGEEVLFLRVCTHNPDMSFGTVRGRGVLSRLGGNARTYLWLIVAAAGVAVVLAIAYLLGLTEAAAELGVVLTLLVIGGLVVVGIVAVVGPVAWIGTRGAEREFAIETTKLESLSPKALLRAAETKPNLRVGRDDLAGAVVDRGGDHSTDKVAVLRFKHPSRGTWAFDLYSDEDTEAACRMLGLPTRRTRPRRRGRVQE